MTNVLPHAMTNVLPRAIYHPWANLAHPQLPQSARPYPCHTASMAAQVIMVCSDTPANQQIVSMLDQVGQILTRVAPPDLKVVWWVTWEGSWARHLLARCSQPALVVVAGEDGRRAVETARILKEDVSRLVNPPAFIAVVNSTTAERISAATSMAAIAAVDTWGYVTSGCFDKVVAFPLSSEVAYSLVVSKLWPRAIRASAQHAPLPHETPERQLTNAQQLPVEKPQESQPEFAAQQPAIARKKRDLLAQDVSVQGSEQLIDAQHEARRKRPSLDEVDDAIKSKLFALPKRTSARMLLFSEEKKENQSVAAKANTTFRIRMVDAELAKLLEYDDARQLVGLDFVSDVVLHIGSSTKAGNDKTHLTDVLHGNKRDNLCLCLATKSGSPSLPFNFSVRWLKNAATSKYYAIIAHFVLCANEAAMFHHRQYWSLKNALPQCDTYEPPSFALPIGKSLDSYTTVDMPNKVSDNAEAKDAQPAPV